MINYNAQLCGSGKSTEILNNIQNLSDQNQPSILANPSLAIHKEVKGFASYLNIDPDIFNIVNSETVNSNKSVVATTQRLLNNEEKVLVVTHENLLNLPFNKLSDHELFIDETFNPIYPINFSFQDFGITNTRKMFLDLLNEIVDIQFDGLKVTFTPKDIPDILSQIKLSKYGNSFYDNFLNDFVRYLTNSNYTIMTEKTNWDLFVSGEKISITFLCIFDINLLNKTKNTTISSALFPKSALYQIGKAMGIEFKSLTDLSKLTKHNIPLHIKYGFDDDRVWSKYSQDKNYRPFMMAVRKDVLGNKTKKKNIIIQTNKGAKIPPDLKGNVVANNCYGLNNLRESNTVILAGAFNDSPVVLKLLKQLFDIDAKQWLSNAEALNAYQVICRSCIRDGKSATVYVPNKSLATYLSFLFENSTIEKLDVKFPLSQTERTKKFIEKKTNSTPKTTTSETKKTQKKSLFFVLSGPEITDKKEITGNSVLGLSIKEKEMIVLNEPITTQINPAKPKETVEAEGRQPVLSSSQFESEIIIESIEQERKLETIITEILKWQETRQLIENGTFNITEKELLNEYSEEFRKYLNRKKLVYQTINLKKTNVLVKNHNEISLPIIGLIRLKEGILNKWFDYIDIFRKDGIWYLKLIRQNDLKYEKQEKLINLKKERFDKEQLLWELTELTGSNMMISKEDFLQEIKKKNDLWLDYELNKLLEQF